MPHYNKAEPTPAELERVRQMYAGDDLTCDEIGGRFGRPASWVGGLARKHGWPIRPPGWRRGGDNKRAPRKPTTPEGTKARRPRSHAVKTLRQIAQDRAAEQERIAATTYGTGELRKAVDYLRTKFAINREDGMFRVGGTLRTEAEVREIAARERRLEQPAPAMLSVIATARTGRTAPPAGTGSSVPKALPKPAADGLVCKECGEPRIASLTDLCRDCALEQFAELRARKRTPKRRRAGVPA